MKKQATPSNAPVEQSAAPTPPQPGWRYVGPRYQRGVYIAGDPTLYRPADFSDSARETFLQKAPQCAEWWEAE